MAQLKASNAEQKDRIDTQYSRLNDIVSGMDIKPKTYAKAAAHALGHDIEPSEEERITVEEEETNSCRDNLEEQIKRKLLLRQGKNIRGTKVYLNEHLTQKNGDIARKARFLKKKNKIQGTWSSNCKVFIKLNGHSPEQGKVILIRKLDELSKYE
ncbi:hypothetical protein ABVT39_010222 [Epinephelus coioides]